MINYIVTLGLFLQLVTNLGKVEYKETFLPPSHTVSYLVKDPTVTNKSGVYTLTDTFLGLVDLPYMKLKHVYIYNEHGDDLYKDHPHFEDTPMLITKNEKFWNRLYSVGWKPVKKMSIVYIPKMEVIDSSSELHWMPETLYVGEQWRGDTIFGGNIWTHNWHKIIDYQNGIWSIHSISIYVNAPTTSASCYDEKWKNDIQIYEKMTDCHDHTISIIKVK